MKKQISLMALGMGIMLMINACQTPEERAAEKNKQQDVADNNANKSDNTPGADTASTSYNAATTNDNSSSSTESNDLSSKKKTGKGKATVDMTASSASNEKIEMDKNGVYARAEVMPSYPGGEGSLEKFVEDNLQYPQEAIDNGVEGRVLVTFDVDETGKIYRPAIASEKIGYGLEEEALKIVKAMPQWNPGKLKGKNVKTKFTLPIIYQIM